MTGDADSGSSWQVYMIKTEDHRLYTGITKDLQRRWRQHASMSVGGSGGAKFFRARKPLAIVFVRQADCRASATRYEMAVKKLSRKRKLELISSDANQIAGTPLDWIDEPADE